MAVSQDIAKEVVFLFHSFLLGAVITFGYDGFLILRKLFRHTSFLISLEDLVFWITCAIGVFCVLYEENNGTLRWFAVAGAALGMAVYKKTVSPLLIHIVYKALSFVLHVIGKAVKVLLKPFGILGSRAAKGAGAAGRKAGMLRKLIKKRLTRFVKTLRIMINRK